MEKQKNTGVSLIENFKGYAVGIGLTAMTLPGMAFAQSGDFDGAAIVTKVGVYVAVGITILAAFALGRWTLKAMGLIGGR